MQNFGMTSKDQSIMVCYGIFCSGQLHYSRGTQREYSSKPLKHNIVKGILVFKR